MEGGKPPLKARMNLKSAQTNRFFYFLHDAPGKGGGGRGGRWRGGSRGVYHSQFTFGRSGGEKKERGKKGEGRKIAPYSTI